MARKLSQEEIVTLKTLKKKGQSNVEIGRTLGVSEGAVRYHLRRAAASRIWFWTNFCHWVTTPVEPWRPYANGRSR